MLADHWLAHLSVGKTHFGCHVCTVCMQWYLDDTKQLAVCLELPSDDVEWELLLCHPRLHITCSAYGGIPAHTPNAPRIPRLDSCQEQTTRYWVCSPFRLIRPRLYFDSIGANGPPDEHPTDIHRQCLGSSYYSVLACCAGKSTVGRPKSLGKAWSF